MSSTARNSININSTQDVVAAIQSAVADKATVSASRTTSEDVRHLDLSTMDGLVEYPARDMTVTVESGMSLQTLTDLLLNERQQLPLDYGDPTMSIGAFVAADLAGSRQYGYGTMRDYLIGMEAVDGQGRVFHAGGRVVKNVAGYDLCRLMTGSRGRLGILTRLTFKLKPLPEASRIQRWHFDSLTAVDPGLESLTKTVARPVLIDLECTDTSEVALYAGVEGRPDVCDWQIEHLNRELAGATSTAEYATDPVGIEVYCRQKAAMYHDTNTRCVVRTVPSKVTAICKRLRQDGLSVSCHAGNGIIVAATDTAQSLSQEVLQDIRQQLKDHGGHLQQMSNAATVRRGANSFSSALIDAFDPHGVFG